MVNRKQEPGAVKDVFPAGDDEQATIRQPELFGNAGAKSAHQDAILDLEVDVAGIRFADDRDAVRHEGVLFDDVKVYPNQCPALVDEIGLREGEQGGALDRKATDPDNLKRHYGAGVRLGRRIGAYGWGKPKETVEIKSELTEDEYREELAIIAREHLDSLPHEERIKLLSDPAPSDTIQ